MKTKQRSPIKLSACSREREAITDTLLSHFRFCSSKRKPTTKIFMIWNETEACVKFVPIMTAINYILHEKAFVSMQKKKK